MKGLDKIDKVVPEYSITANNIKQFIRNTHHWDKTVSVTKGYCIINFHLYNNSSIIILQLIPRDDIIIKCKPITNLQAECWRPPVASSTCWTAGPPWSAPGPPPPQAHPPPPLTLTGVCCWSWSWSTSGCGGRNQHLLVECESGPGH